MKIGIVTEYFYPTIGGISENIAHFSRELLRHGHDLRIITGRRERPREIEAAIRDRIVHVGQSMPIFLNGSCGWVTIGGGLKRRMRELLDVERFDLLHLHSPHIPTLPFVANSQTNCPMVGTFHTCMGPPSLFAHLMRGIYGGISKRLVHRLDGRIAVSTCCAEENRFFYPEAHFDVIPNGVDVDWWRSGKRIAKFDDGKINVLFIGRPDTRNGLDTLIRAFADAFRAWPDLRLIVVGDGPLTSYFEKIVPESVRNAVHFEGASLGTRANYMATADIFCFTPTVASFGITILEGMSGGVAMIASDIPAFRQLVRDAESALLVPPSDAGALAQAILRLAEDANLRRRLGAAALARAGDYDWSRVTQMHLNYYDRILGKG